MDANRLAHSLHKRRLMNNPNAARHQAAGEAKFFSTYGHEPDLDDFDAYMRVMMDTPGGVLTVVTSADDSWDIMAEYVLAAQLFVFTKGETLAETNVVGWLPQNRVQSAPRIGDVSTKGVTVNEFCIFPMPGPPMTDNPLFDPVLVEPEIDTPGIWDYDLQALWTPLGFGLYDYNMRQQVEETDREMR